MGIYGKYYGFLIMLPEMKSLNKNPAWAFSWGGLGAFPWFLN